MTGPALLETLYELGRLATLPPKAEELEQARQYALGTLAARHVHPGRAGRRWPARTPASGCGWTSCAGTRRALAAATRTRWRRRPRQYLAPARAVTVVLGDAARIEDARSRALGPVERMSVDDATGADA